MERMIIFFMVASHQFYTQTQRRDTSILCPASSQVAAIDLKAGALLTLLDVGKTPMQMAMKPDGGELFVCNFNSSSVSVIETAANEVGGTYLMGDQPMRALVSSDNSLLYVANFGSDNVSVFSINDGRLIDSVQVGHRPDAMALTPAENFLLVADSASGDVAVVRLMQMPRGQKISTTEAILKGQNPSKARALVTMIPVGVGPNSIAVKVVE